jgi:hypothetical protein
MVDRHKLWRRVASDYEELKALTPEGFQPVVLVFVRGLGKPLELGFVRTLQDPEYPWVRFEMTRGVPPARNLGQSHRMRAGSTSMRRTLSVWRSNFGKRQRSTNDWPTTGPRR